MPLLTGLSSLLLTWYASSTGKISVVALLSLLNKSPNPAACDTGTAVSPVAASPVNNEPALKANANRQDFFDGLLGVNAEVFLRSYDYEGLPIITKIQIDQFTVCMDLSIYIIIYLRAVYLPAVPIFTVVLISFSAWQHKPALAQPLPADDNGYIFGAFTIIENSGWW